mgnify:CR=1 FL=1
MYKRQWLQRAQRLPNLAQVISSMDDSGDGAADLLFVGPLLSLIQLSRAHETVLDLV